MIDLRQLTYFIAVVEAKSLSGAAQVLSIAQPALSKHLRRLEEDVGQQLLIRHSRGVEPTLAGQRLIEHSRAILRSVDYARRDLRGFNEQPTIQMRVGMPRSLSDTFGLALLTSWSVEHPNVRLQIVEQYSDTLTEWMMAGRLDLAISSFPTDSSAMISEPLLQDKMFAVMPRDSAAATGPINLAELVGLPLVLQTAGYVSRQLIDMTAKYSSIDLSIRYEVDSFDLAIKLVEAGAGVTIQPYLAIRRCLQAKSMHARLIVNPGITRRLHLIRPRNRPLSEAGEQLRAAIKKILWEELANDRSAEVLQVDFDPESSVGISLSSGVTTPA